MVDESPTYQFVWACMKNDALQACILLEKHKKEILSAASRHLLAEEASYGNLLALQLLLDNGADINAHDQNGTALYLACKRNRLETVNFLLDSGADTEITKHDLTPMMVAARKGNLECIKALNKHGANIHCKGYYGESAVYYAVTGHQPDTLEYLLQLGVECNGPIPWAENNENYLDLAIEERNWKCASILYEYGLRPNVHTWPNQAGSNVESN